MLKINLYGTDTFWTGSNNPLNDISSSMVSASFDCMYINAAPSYDIETVQYLNNIQISKMSERTTYNVTLFRKDYPTTSTPFVDFYNIRAILDKRYLWISTTDYNIDNIPTDQVVRVDVQDFTVTHNPGFKVITMNLYETYPNNRRD